MSPALNDVDRVSAKMRETQDLKDKLRAALAAVDAQKDAEFIQWLEDSYELSDAKANGYTLEQLARMPEVYAEFKELGVPA